MARAVQCPACGEAHPVDTLEGTPTFSCAGCGRTLRTPTELVRPSGATPAVRSGPESAPTAAAQPSRAARRAPARTPKPRSRSTGTSSPSSRAPDRAPRPRRVGIGMLSLPVRVAAWIVAVVIGLLLTWFVASAFGFISRSQIVDMFRSSRATNYTRLFLLIPMWAFMSACLATALIEGTRLVVARRDRLSGGTPAAKPRPPQAALHTHVPAVDDHPREPEPARNPLPPGQRTRIRPREPTV
jgi:hypothetical protein